MLIEILWFCDYLCTFKSFINIGSGKFISKYSKKNNLKQDVFILHYKAALFTIGIKSKLCCVMIQCAGWVGKSWKMAKEIPFLCAVAKRPDSICQRYCALTPQFPFL
jgi:hypothetical protein